MKIRKAFETNERDFQDEAFDLGFCESCEKTYFDSDYGYHVCPYEDGPEAYRYCPYSEAVCEIIEEEGDEEE